MRKVYRWTLWIYVALLTIGSLQRVRPGGVHGGFIHFPGHIVCFAVLFLLSRAAFADHRWEGFLACVFLGLTLETLQHIEYHITMEWLDVWADTLGVLIACIGNALPWRWLYHPAARGGHPPDGGGG